jgi:hypothetical protein
MSDIPGTEMILLPPRAAGRQARPPLASEPKIIL